MLVVDKRLPKPQTRRSFNLIQHKTNEKQLFDFFLLQKYYQLWIRLVQFNQEIFIQDQSNIINSKLEALSFNIIAESTYK